MQRTIKAFLCLLAIAALLTTVGCGKKAVVSEQDKPLRFYNLGTILQTEEWGQQSLASTLAAQGGKVESFRIREGTQQDPFLSVTTHLTINPQAGEAISKMIAGFCLQALPKYEQAQVILHMPTESGSWIWSKNGELVKYTPLGTRG